MKIVYFILIILLTQCCRPNVQDLKKEYSSEVINYFYETAFFQDHVGKKNIVNKWKKDVYIYMTGEFYPNDMDYVKNVIAQLNSLKLPIDIHFTPDSSKANMFIHFGDYTYLEKIGISDSPLKPYRGKFQIIDHKPYYKRAIVKIANINRTSKGESKTDSINLRQAVILEEVTQCLGIIGDSWHYPNSIFFESENGVIDFSTIDKGVVQFLYEPSIPTPYSRQQFEKDFGDVLHHINAPKKIADYIVSNNIPLHYLEYIREKCFLPDSTLVKWPTEIFINLEKPFSKEDSVFCNNAVSLLNSISDKFQLSFTNNVYEFSKININYMLNDTMKKHVSSERIMYTSKMMFPRRQVYDINITDGGKENTKKTKHNVIFSTLYESLGFNSYDINQDVMKLDSLGNVSFNPDYKEILALIYEPVFYSGLTIDEFDEAIEILKGKGYSNEN